MEDCPISAEMLRNWAKYSFDEIGYDWRWLTETEKNIFGDVDTFNKFTAWVKKENDNAADQL